MTARRPRGDAGKSRAAPETAMTRAGEMFERTKKALLDARLQALRGVVDDLVRELHGLADDTGSAELAETVQDLRGRLAEPFLFVIVGEVKAGKSAFVNALLGAPVEAEITATAPDPKTDRITQIVYGEAPETIDVNPHLRKVLYPADILREIAVVDTPGTNTLVEHHQEITERFVPGSDLVVFVFEAKNPYRKSAWEFFDFIHEEWHKKVVFVLQQADLLSDEERRVNVERVAGSANERGMTSPDVFAVSAKLELEGDVDGSGFGALRAYIQEHVTGGQAPRLKLENVLDTASTVVDRIADAVELRRERLAADRAFRAEVDDTLGEQEARSLRQVELLADALAGGYDQATGKARDKIRSGLGFFSLARRSLLAMFSRESSVAEWLKRIAGELEGELNGRLGEKLEGGVNDLAGNVWRMASELDARVETKLAEERVKIRRTEEIFGQVAEQRSLILLQLRERLSAFLDRDVHYLREDLFPEHVPFSPDIAAGGGVAALGVALTALTQGAFFDVTGGVLTTVGLLFAGVATTVRRGKLLRDFDAEVARGRDRLTERVREQLGSYVRELRGKLDGNFTELDAMITREDAAIEDLDARVAKIRGRLEDARGRLDG